MSGPAAQRRTRLRSTPAPGPIRLLPRGAAAALELAPALTAPARLALLDGPAGTVVQRLHLPGLAGRYLTGVARHAAAAGWSAAELAALLDGLEERSRAWIAAPSLAPLERAGLLRRRLLLPSQAGCWDGRGWRASLRRREGLLETSRAGAAPGSLLLAAGSGSQPPRRLLAALAAAAPAPARQRGGLAAALGVAWALELVVTPRLTDTGLAALRERVAAAPRCDWCGVPVLARSCRRCGSAAS